MNLKELYQEIILEHGKNPRNLGKTDDLNKDARGHNPLCGDNVHVYLKLNGQKIVEDISFASCSFLPLIKSVIMDADAIEIAHPLPSKEISSTIFCPLSFK